MGQILSSSLTKCNRKSKMTNFVPKKTWRHCFKTSMTSIFRYEQDPQGNGKEKVAVLCPEIDDIFGLKMHSVSEEGNSTIISCLSAALPDGFLLIFDPLMGDHKQLDRQIKRLNLPRSVVNIRIKLNLSNSCILIPGNQYLVAGVRRDIFVWNWNKEQLLR